MKTPARKTAGRSGPARELTALRARLAVATATLRAIRRGEVDTVSVAGRQGRLVFTLQGTEHAYRMLIESMNEGALMLTGKKIILYANRCFARMVRCPLEQVIGSSFRRFLSPEDRTNLRRLMMQSASNGSKVPLRLLRADGSPCPAQISVQEIDRDGAGNYTLGMIVTDMTEVRQHEGRLRALTQRVVQAQESERGRVALELHDNITQLLTALAFRSEALQKKLSSRAGPARREALALREMLGQTAIEVERISRNLRPSVLDQLGLDAVLRESCTEFAQRTGLMVKLAAEELPERLPADAELALYRIFQEALKNVEKHAHARRVTVDLTQPAGCVQLTIIDDGIGFDSNRRPSARKGVRGLGLLGMAERAAYVHATLTVKSGLRAGTEIVVCLPRTTAAPGAEHEPI